MKHKIIVSLETLLLLIILTVGTVFANQAGGQSDPLVTKSYVDDKITKAIQSLNTSNINNSNTNNTNTQFNKYVPVFATVGQTLYGKEGTEIILRSGKGVAYVPTKEGIANLTTGQDLANNAIVGRNHLLITPRDDGRGIKITENAWFLVRGEYSIK